MNCKWWELQFIEDKWCYLGISGAVDKMLWMFSRGDAKGTHAVILAFGTTERDTHDAAVALTTDDIRSSKSTF